MNEIDKNLSTILEVEVVGEVETIEPETVSTEVVPLTVEDENLPMVRDPKRDLEFDYEVSRETHRELLEAGQEALAELLKVAKESQHPRAYEVVGQMLKNLSDMTDKLMDLQKKMKELEGRKDNDAPQVNVDKAVFVGSTSDLLKQIKNQ